MKVSEAYNTCFGKPYIVLVKEHEEAKRIIKEALEMQDKLKQWIENYKNPEFKDVMITRDGLIDILEEFRLECETEC